MAGWHYAEDETNRWVIAAGWGAVATGLILLVLPTSALAGLAAIVAGAVGLAASNHGRRWGTIPTWRKALVIPSVAASLALLLTVGLVVFVVVAAFKR